MKPYSLKPNKNAGTTATHRISPTNATDLKTYALAGDTSAIILSVLTTDARVTFDGTDPSSGTLPHHVYAQGGGPWFIPVGPGTTIQAVSTAGTTSNVNITELV